LGVEGFTGTLDATRSGIAVRRYAPYNTYLRAPDREHVVIAAGSVLVYADVAPFDRGAFRAGVGVWRERGLGLVWPDPPLLATRNPTLDGLLGTRASGAVRLRPVATSKASSGSLGDADATILATLTEFALGRRDGRAKAETGKAIRRKLETQLQAAARRGAATPGPTQWSLLAEISNGCRTIGELHSALFRRGEHPGDRGICVGPANEDWKAIRNGLAQMIESRHGIPAGVRQDRADRVFLVAMTQAARALAREWKPRAAS
jgi:hypothetical protein